MAGGLNGEFKSNPHRFVQTHDITVAPQPVGARAIAAGPTGIDLVMVDGSINPKVTRLETYALRSHGWFAESEIRAFFLPAVVDNTSSVSIAPAGPEYMFTADLSGCLFAAYGPDNSNLTVEHVNVRTINGAGLVGFRAHQILNGGHNYVFMITPQPIANQRPPTVVTYATGGVVVGKRNAGSAWNFIYRLDGNPTAFV